MTATTASPPAADQIHSFPAPVEDVFDDTVWIDAEFYAIIAANFDTEPPKPPDPPTGLPARWNQPDDVRWQRGPRHRPAGQVMAGDQHRRQRSPPKRK